MAKRPRGGKGQRSEEPGHLQEPVKYSVLMPPDLDQKISEICKLRRISLSLYLRQLVENTVDLDLLRAQGKKPEETPVSEGGGLLIQPSEDTLRLLNETSAGLNMTADQVVQLLLRRHLPSLFQESVELREQFTALLRPRRPAERKADNESSKS